MPHLARMDTLLPEDGSLPALQRCMAAVLCLRREVSGCKCHPRFMTTIERVALVTLACEGRQLCFAVCPLLPCSTVFISLPTAFGLLEIMLKLILAAVRLQ